MIFDRVCRAIPIALMVALASCAPQGHGPSGGGADISAQSAAGQRYLNEVRATIRARIADGLDEDEFIWLFPSYEQAINMLGGRTYLTYSKGHGQQIEFISEHGDTYLWYPGNKSMVRGHWKYEIDIPRSLFGKILVRTDKGVETHHQVPISRLCFRYSTQTYNPVTRKRGGDWNCRPHFDWAIKVKEQKQGDPFRLSTRARVPFALKRSPAPLDELLTACGDCNRE